MQTSEFGGEKICGGLLGDVSSSSPPSFGFQVSNNTDIGPEHRGIITNGIAYPWL
jgi:hypothetical protein